MMKQLTFLLLLSCPPIEVKAFTLPKLPTALSLNHCLDASSSSVDNELVDTSAAADVGTANSDRKIRPLHQNWWPVSTVEALDPTRPNAVKLLGMDLVLFQSNDNDWSCLQDRCSHRFAPLSEGRIIDSTTGTSTSSDSNGKSNNGIEKHIQCAYHGWEFSNNGRCQNIPQMDSDKKEIKNCNINSYPTQIDCGMVFVWADPSTSNLSTLIPLPTFPLVRRAFDKKGESFCFMRDLPYGYELLGENLLDLSHLPFSHHSMGSLKRDLGGPLPFKMLSRNQRSPDNPLFEGYLENAANTDPILSGNPTTPQNATLHLGFYEPCHVRYTRKSNVDSYVVLFFCPTTESRSRVFLFNLFGTYEDEPPTTMRKRIQDWMKPSIVKSKIQRKIFSLIFTPALQHQFGHQIFDGDGIFLRMQGDRMQRENLTFTDYKTPTSADVLVNAYRRYVKAACDLTREAGKENIAEAASSTKGYGQYLERNAMLDRYESHTKNCKVCSKALKAKEGKRERLQVARAIVNGGIGATSTSLMVAMLCLATTTEVTVPATLLRIVTGALIASVGASFGLKRLDANNEKDMKRFIFEDYVHAEKN